MTPTTTTPKLIPCGRSLDRADATAWLIQPDPSVNIAYPFVVISNATRAKLLRKRAICAGEVVYVADEVPSLDVLAHEAVHVLQFWMKAGGSRLRFYAMYARRSLRKGYLGNAWELEAMSWGPKIAAAFAAEHRAAQA